MNRKINSIPVVRTKIGEQDRRTIMEKHIMGENGISYTLGEDGLYYPDLYLPEETEYPIGKYGMLRKSYLQEHRKGLYLELVFAGKLNKHLHQIDEECNQMMEDRRTIMEKHIMGENGISYTLGEDGLYYPDLYLPEETEYPIGKYGMLRKSYLQEHRKGLYLELVFAGKLNKHLHQIDEECNQMMDRLVEQMKEKQGVTEELKMQDQMAWVGRMNNIRACAEEIILKKIVYR